VRYAQLSDAWPCSALQQRQAPGFRRLTRWVVAAAARAPLLGPRPESRIYKTPSLVLLRVCSYSDFQQSRAHQNPVWFCNLHIFQHEPTILFQWMRFVPYRPSAARAPFFSRSKLLSSSGSRVLRGKKRVADEGWGDEFPMFKELFHPKALVFDLTLDSYSEVSEPFDDLCFT
jgi:hypothetical protein